MIFPFFILTNQLYNHFYDKGDICVSIYIKLTVKKILTVCCQQLGSRIDIFDISVTLNFIILLQLFRWYKFRINITLILVGHYAVPLLSINQIKFAIMRNTKWHYRICLFCFEHICKNLIHQIIRHFIQCCM